MQVPPEIVFRHMAPSPAVEANVRERIDKLARFHDRITSCRVVIEAPHRHKHKGRIYMIRIDLTVPGGEIVVGREGSSADHAHEDPYVAIRDAFDALRRQLEDYVRKHSGHRTKAHPTPLHGRVTRLFPDEGYGFIMSANGDEVYFHRNSVVEDGWKSIEVDVQVRFTQIEGEKGPHAHSVKPIS
ncbi:MAG: HPF/RaiA family ribosome-associated protein [Hyphomicrobiales bacterium]|nr:HPF/RaiA family ribosome-associated protein [Hyphomicrobiales bacterium]